MLGVGLVLIGFNLRPLFSSLAPVLPELMRSLGVSPLGAGILTTVPVVCLGVFALAAPGLAARYSAERLLLVLLVVLAAGTALRGVETFPAILAGSVAGGGSIAMMNVLLPGLVKRDFPDRAALMTGLYSMSMCGGAAFAAGVTVPLSRALHGSWSAALAAWSLPVAAVALFWALTARRVPRPSSGASAAGFGWVWRHPVAWQVTAFMGLQSALAYCVFGWLAPILRERGLDPATAGWVVSVSVFVQVFASFAGPWFATRGRDQRATAAVIIVLAVAGLIGLLYAPLEFVWVVAVLQGAGQGALFSVLMTIIILRSPDAAVAARLSGMAQGGGYVLAACGPLLLGAIRDRAGSFAPAGILFAAIGIAAMAAALGAGRNRLMTRPEA